MNPSCFTSCFPTHRPRGRRRWCQPRSPWWPGRRWLSPGCICLWSSSPVWSRRWPPEAFRWWWRCSRTALCSPACWSPRSWRWMGKLGRKDRNSHVSEKIMFVEQKRACEVGCGWELCSHVGCVSVYRWGCCLSVWAATYSLFQWSKRWYWWSSSPQYCWGKTLPSRSCTGCTSVSWLKERKRGTLKAIFSLDSV